MKWLRWWLWRWWQKNNDDNNSNNWEYVDDNYDNDDNDFNYCNDDNGGDDNDASYDSWYAKGPWLVKIRQNDYDITEWWRFMAKITFSEYFPVVVLAACFLPVWMANCSVINNNKCKQNRNVFFQPCLLRERKAFYQTELLHSYWSKM